MALAIFGVIAASNFAVYAQDKKQGVDPFDPNQQQIDPAEEANTSDIIRVQVEYIEVSLEQFTELMFSEKPAANDTELRKQITQLIKDGKSKIIETQVCTARSGEQTTTESIEEYIYPTEYDPPDFPLVSAPKKDAPGVISAEHILDAIGPRPTAFETRNVGSTLEIEPTATPNGNCIDLRLVPEIVQHPGNTVWSEWKGKYGNSPTQTPLFYTMRIKTAFTLTNNQPLLIATLSPHDEKGAADHNRKLMVFVKANIVKP